VLDVEPGNMVGPTKQGMQDLIDKDRGAVWDESLNDGRGGIKGGCMEAGTCDLSPRVVAIPVYDPDATMLAGPADESRFTSRRSLVSS
jgi:hypothetical protein